MGGDNLDYTVLSFDTDVYSPASQNNKNIKNILIQSSGSQDSQDSPHIDSFRVSFLFENDSKVSSIASHVSTIKHIITYENIYNIYIQTTIYKIK